MTQSILEMLCNTFVAAVKNHMENFELTMEMRNPGDGSGSYFLEDQSVQSLCDAIVEGHLPSGFVSDTRIDSTCRGIRFEGIEGILGMIKLSDLNPKNMIMLINHHPRVDDDFPESSPEIHVSRVPGEIIAKTAVTHGTIILGPHAGKEVVYTLFPGCPTSNSPTIPDVTAFRDVNISVEDAIRLGIKHVKLNRSLEIPEAKGIVKITSNFIDLCAQETLKKKNRGHADVEAYGFSYNTH